jgi:predicted GNAT family N-acyltransferase
MIDVRSVSFAHDEAFIRFIRNNVFSGDQGIDPGLDFDGNDPEAIHVIAFVDGNAVGTGRVLDDGHIGRVAVLAQYRGRGIGSEIVKCLMDEAARGGYPRVYLGSQKHACGFYTKLGFTSYGDVYIEVDIEHILMGKNFGKP